MNISDKLRILSAAAKFDVSCSSSGSSRRRAASNGIGSVHSSGICHSFSSDGRCISLLKILLSNDCIYNCSYCLNRSGEDRERASFSNDELIKLTIDFYKRNYIEGLFLSSAIERNPDYTMERIREIVKRLRNEEGFGGYIHIKAIPGAGKELIDSAGTYADRMSVNIELPSSDSLHLLAPQKRKETIITSFKNITSSIEENRDLKKKFKHTPSFIPAGQSTQLIVGASPESDSRIIHLSEGLYRKFQLKRVYYSAYVPVTQSPLLPSAASPPLLRENRLYQADWLLRFYNFSAQELFSGSDENLPYNIDPKTAWAINNFSFFPVDINKATYEQILRVPGIGVRTAKRILVARRYHSISIEDLAKLGAVLKRARYFIATAGKNQYEEKLSLDAIRLRLTQGKVTPYKQLGLFDNVTKQIYNQTITGEI